jgi:thioredoxin 1
MASPHVVEFTQDNWESEVVNSPVPVLVDFWAPWCGPCRQLTPIIDKIADSYAGKVKVGKVNIDEQYDLGSKYQISTIPRLLIFKGSAQPVNQLVGLTNEATLSKMLNDVV